MIPRHPADGESAIALQTSGTIGRLERRKGRKPAKATIAIDPAVLRAFKGACRRRHSGRFYGGVIERLAVMFLRAGRSEREVLIQMGNYHPELNAAEQEQHVAELARGIAGLLVKPTPATSTPQPPAGWRLCLIHEDDSTVARSHVNHRTRTLFVSTAGGVEAVAHRVWRGCGAIFAHERDADAAA